MCDYMIIIYFNFIYNALLEGCAGAVKRILSKVSGVSNIVTDVAAKKVEYIIYLDT